jgi:hypothetical protein
VEESGSGGVEEERTTEGEAEEEGSPPGVLVLDDEEETVTFSSPLHNTNSERAFFPCVVTQSPMENSLRTHPSLRHSKLS